MKKAEYVELICKSNFSFLTGASHPEELILSAIQQNLRGLALTDINGVYGIGRAYKEAKHHPEFKYIIGTELTFTDHSDLILIAQNRKGYGTLTKLISHSHANKPKGGATLTLSEFKEKIDNYGNDGILILPRISDRTNISFLKDIFNQNLYLPLNRHLDGCDKRRTEQVLELSKTYNLSIVATNDVYYHVKSRKPLQDILVSIREGRPLHEVGYKLFPNAERYIKTPQQMAKLFEDLPEAISNTLKISESCSFSLSELKYRYPSEWIPQGHTAHSYLEHLVWSRWPNRYSQLPQDVRTQLEHELSLIGTLGYADYFLTIFDIVEYATSRNILCQGRGSAANSAVCYILGITSIDPIKMKLLFERFISTERNEPPDIDVDFEHERREEVIQYIYQKYGRHRAAMVSAVITYRRRSAFREVSKAFGIPVGSLSARKLENHFEELSQNFPNPQNLKIQIETWSKELKGFPRHLSIHSGGFTLSADPILEIVPVEPARMENRSIIQWDKYDLDELGLLKIDVLSLGMLSALQKTLSLIGKKLHEIPQDNAETYSMIQRCDTVGTFQIESRAQMSMLGRLCPENFYDLVIEIAIVRPGPIVGKMIHPYLKRRHGLEKIVFVNEKIESILGRTLGIPLFQEQIMKLAIDLAHFTPGEADRLRKSISAWRSSAPISKMAERLMSGLIEGGLPKEFAQQIFDQIQGFSEYGFPESHAASFALLAYASCYLKCHHPAEFAASLINSQPMGFYRTDTLVYDAIRHGVKVLPVCVQKSYWDCTIESANTLRLGFRVIKGLSKEEALDVIVEREKEPFLNLTDFLKRSNLRKDILHRLALAGRLSSQEMDARQTLWAILEYENLFTSSTPHQLNLFNTLGELKSDGSFSSLSGFEKIQNDYESTRLSMHGHPMGEIRKHLKLPKTNSLMLKKLNHGAHVSVSGLTLVRQKPPTAKGVVFSTLEDEFGFIDVVLHNDIYQKYFEVYMNHCFLTVTGVVQKSGFSCSILVSDIQALWNSSSSKKSYLENSLDFSNPLHLEPTTYFHA